MSTENKTETATFGGGCFWGVQNLFLKHYPIAEKKGVLSTTVGYTGGKEEAKNPTYRDVCTSETDHAEALKVEFDPSIVKYEELVEFFYRIHDPTTLNSQGHNVGTQYRSVIYYHTPEQQEIAKQVTEKVQKEHFDPIDKKIVTEILPAKHFWDAEEYHQEYLIKNPNGPKTCPAHYLRW